MSLYIIYMYALNAVNETISEVQQKICSHQTLKQKVATIQKELVSFSITVNGF